MTYNKLNLYFFIFLLLTSISTIFFSMNMIIYDYAIMLEWMILSLHSCNIYGSWI